MHSINQCNLSETRTCNRSMRGNHLEYAATQCGVVNAPGGIFNIHGGTVHAPGVIVNAMVLLHVNALG